ncbi:MAG: dihydrolipoamide acetyltransferase family protein [Dehalococcoidia bacterium]
MAVEMVIPKLGMTMEEGTVAEWLIPDGATVKPGDMIYRLETEKIEMEIEAEGEGTLHHLAPEGAVLACGAPVAQILAAGESAPPAGAPATPAPAAAAPATPVAAAAPAPVATGERAPSTPAARKLAADRGIDIALVAGTGPGGRITEADVQAYQPAAAAPALAAASDAPASPLARKLAEQLGVDLARVKGSGPGGRITKEDVEAAAAAPTAPAAKAPAAPTASAPRAAASPASGGVVPIRGMRKVIFERMHQSLHGMAQLTMGVEVWMDEAVRLRGQMIEEWSAEGVRPGYTDMIIRAVAKALKQHARFNAEVRDDGIHLLTDIHVGMAVALDEGLVVPVIRNTDRLSLKEIAVESKRLADAARNGKLGPDDYVGGTFSVTALGMFGVDLFTPIINPPNVAILGVGRIHDGIDWEGDRPVKRPTMTLSLTWDHRVNDGAPAAELVRTIKGLLEAPYRLLV